jgi:hypothetical protein
MPNSKPFFSGITQARFAFVPPIADDRTKSVAEHVLNTLRQSDELGFRKKASKVELEQKVRRTLKETGQDLNDSDAEKVVNHVRAIEEMTIARRRFWAQCAVSLLIVLFAIFMLSRSQSNETVEKALFGLLGTVLGYWLR